MPFVRNETDLEKFLHDKNLFTLKKDVPINGGTLTKGTIITHVTIQYSHDNIASLHFVEYDAITDNTEYCIDDITLPKFNELFEQFNMLIILNDRAAFWYMLLCIFICMTGLTIAVTVIRFGEITLCIKIILAVLIIISILGTIFSGWKSRKCHNDIKQACQKVKA